MTRRTIAVVGASLSGLRAAQQLRAQGYDDDLVMVGAEPHLPYDRPPLSKEYLLGRVGAADLALAEQSDIDELDARWHLGVAAERLDPAGGRVVLASGEHIAPTESSSLPVGCRAGCRPPTACSECTCCAPWRTRTRSAPS